MIALIKNFILLLPERKRSGGDRNVSVGCPNHNDKVIDVSKWDWSNQSSDIMHRVVNIRVKSWIHCPLLIIRIGARIWQFKQRRTQAKNSTFLGMIFNEVLSKSASCICVPRALCWLDFIVDRTSETHSERILQSSFPWKVWWSSINVDLPSALQLGPRGDLILVDHKGNSTTVSKTNLPFVVGGGRTESPEVHTMTALGERENGILKSPMVTIYLTVQGRKISIQSIES